MAVLVPIVTALVGVIKKTGYLPKEWTPLTSGLIGAAIALVVVGASGLVGLAGFIVGLSSVGLYEAGKQATKPKEVVHSS